MAEYEKFSDHRSLAARLIDLLVEAAWLRRCGTGGQPGRWLIPGEFLAVGEIGEAEVELYPVFATVDDGGAMSGWSAHLRPNEPNVAEAWEWRVNFGWEDLPSGDVDRLEDLGACVDERATSFAALGGHQSVPPVPAGLCDAVAILGWPDRAGQEAGRR